ncbi:hypothetical protein RclHR1_02720007 [Rhizophagus clarus]|uniref:TLDc domain-containing protein n=1 Tax=Rhizophagus clarus TaxID=94130 RepID=A0A2Z6R627_9GLOM|nr:hypothetical protein RclHR1_02720007 [Rhizophagus clarus]
MGFGMGFGIWDGIGNGIWDWNGNGIWDWDGMGLGWDGTPIPFKWAAIQKIILNVQIFHFKVFERLKNNGEQDYLNNYIIPTRVACRQVNIRRAIILRNDKGPESGIPLEILSLVLMIGPLHISLNIEWKSANGYSSTKNRVIFSFENSINIENYILSRVKDEGYAIWNGCNYGSYFGWCDLVFYERNYNFSRISEYEKPIMETKDIFSVEECEIFQITKNSND